MILYRIIAGAPGRSVTRVTERRGRRGLPAGSGACVPRPRAENSPGIPGS